MKKLLIMILSAMIILSACGTGEVPSDGEIRIISTDLNICNDGELYTDNQQRMNFIDFTTMQSALLCSKPNCSHDDASICSSYGMSNGTVLYGSNIYFFDNDITQKNGKAEYVTKLIKANIDGTGRSTAVEINDRNSESYDQRFLVGDTLFFTTQKVSFDEFGRSTSYRENYLCSYNFTSGEYSELLMTLEGWNAGTRIFGVYNGGVFYNTSYVEEEIPWQSYFDSDFTVDYLNDWYRYDIESGMADKIDYEVTYGQNGYYVEVRDGVSTLYSPSGTTRDITFHVGYYTIVNSKLFDAAGGTVFDIESGKKYKLLSKDIVVYYIDGKYVTKGNHGGENASNAAEKYKKLSESEVIGAEIT